MPWRVQYETGGMDDEPERALSNGAASTDGADAQDLDGSGRSIANYNIVSDPLFFLKCDVARIWI